MTMSAQLTVHDIGRAGDPAATVTTEHFSARTAYEALGERYGFDNLRGDDIHLSGMKHGSGTVGGFTGRVFQASKVWSIS
jgi:hypothetical protein